jgi:hypothetical protein
MPIPSRPVTLTTIASEWGQYTHDYTFAPAGCIVSGVGQFMLTGNAYRDLALSVADDDPGGYLDATNWVVEVPADGAGLYLIVLSAITDHGDTADESGIVLRLNGTEIARTQVAHEGETEISFPPIVLVEPLTVGDQITLRGRQIGSGDRAATAVRSLTLVRLGAELGSPTT